MSAMVYYTSSNEEFHRAQQLLLQQLMSQNGLTINSETASILHVILNQHLEEISDFLSRDDPNKSSTAFFERVVDLTLLEKDSKISKEDRIELVKFLEGLFSGGVAENFNVINIGRVPDISESAFISPSITVPEARWQEVPTTYIPPKAEIKNVSPQEFFTFQKELFDKGSIHKYGSDEPPILDRLSISVASVGNARIVDLEEYSELCRTSLGNRYNTTKNSEWLQLRRSTYPFSVLSDSERESIQEHIEEIISYAISAGLLIVVIYLVIEVEKLKHKKSQTINTSGGDVVLENGYLDKREGVFFYVTLSEEKGQTYVEEQEIKDIQIQFERPTDKLFKPIIVLVDPDDTSKFYAFPITTYYLTENKINIAETRLGKGNLDNCKIAPLLPYSNNQISASKKLIELLNDKSAMVRAIAADVLGEIKTENVVQELGTRLRKEKSNKVISNILSSLLDIGSENAVNLVFEYAANHDLPELMVSWCAQKANAQSLLSLFHAATNYPTSMSSQKIFETTNLRNIDFEPIIREFNSNVSDNVKLNMSKFFIAILEKPLDKKTKQNIVSALTQSMIKDNQDVAVEISRGITNLVTLDSEDVNVLIEALDSPYVEVRKRLVKKLGYFLKKQK